jgi:opacity protein-like surface antigen
VNLRKYFLAAAAAAAIASPAAARDGSGYFGVEAGVLFPKDNNVDFSGTYAYSEGGTYDFDASYKTNYKTGYDLDLIAGYDLGLVRLEGELAYKRAGHKSYDNAVLVATSSEGDTFTYGPYDVDADGKTTVLSGMVNALLDFGDENGFSFYAGGGIGWARTKYTVEFDDPTDADFVNIVRGSAKDSGFAWQAIAGVRYAISPNMDVGLKYRYFRGNKVEESGDFDDGTVTGTFDAHTRFKSHSLLASLIFNFGGAEAPPPPPPPEPAPPPPPPPPATQTCPDGTVILATEACPAPPPPPPPPPPAPERG